MSMTDQCVLRFVERPGKRWRVWLSFDFWRGGACAPCGLDVVQQSVHLGKNGRNAQLR